jgi:hypothetical protein
MNRFIVALTAALACAMAVQAQEQKTKTEVKGPGSQIVTYTGCVQGGTEARTFILDKVVPVSRTTEEVGTSGTVVKTETRYMLVPDEKVELVQQVGHKVEVTGMLIPAGGETKRETKIEREHGEDTKITEKTKGDNDLPQFKVISVKQLAESCQ